MALRGVGFQYDMIDMISELPAVILSEEYSLLFIKIDSQKLTAPHKLFQGSRGARHKPLSPGHKLKRP